MTTTRRARRTAVPPPTGPGTFKPAGGWTAEVTKTGELRYRAHGVYVVLNAGGVISAHA
ncbi:hypothetical protein ACWDE0_16570 [Streptomyces sp. 900105755]|uniref:hypothetical protein n=1 Tax=Streptomyces sp. 900105755 TaxID=3154389 RepID=UPI00331E5090